MIPPHNKQHVLSVRYVISTRVLFLKRADEAADPHALCGEKAKAVSMLVLGQASPKASQ